MGTPGKSITVKGKNANITFADSDDWGSGFIGNVSFINNLATGLQQWTIEFDLLQSITSIWNATIVSHVGTHYVIRNASWNGSVAAGGTVSFGFQAAGGNPVLPASFILNGTTISGGGTSPPPVLPTISIADATVTENGSATVNETFTVRLSAASASTVTVAYRTTGGTAVQGTDFDGATGTITFAPGTTTQTVTIKTHPGAQGTKTYTVALSSPTNATIADGSAVGTIVNPAPKPLPTLSIDDASVTETGAATLNQSFTVRLSAASTSTVTVAYRTTGGTAVQGTDFDGATGTITFAPGTTTQTVAIKTHPGTQGTKAYTVTLSSPTNATIADGSATGTIINPAPKPTPTITVADITVHEPPVNAVPDGPTSLLPNGYLNTSGSQIVDATGASVKIAAVNWFGMETSNFAPHGLWTAGYKTMMDQMVQLGFNAIRLPFSDQLFDSSSKPNGIDFSKNPDLQGLTGLQIMDKIVAYAGQKGLKIILDHHRSSAGNGPNGNGLWYDSAYSEQKMISNWTMLAQRYANNPTVIAADLANEPHGPSTWGDGSANDWAAAATRIGNAIGAANPNWLIMVEGIETYQGNSTWWGGNLMGVKDHPITLNVANKLVYSPHDYPSTVYAQSWFSAPDYPNNLPAVWDKYWGYIFKDGTAPLLLGEFGTNLQTTSDQQWLNKLVAYMDESSSNGGLPVAGGNEGPSWAYWSWNPNSGDTGGILQNDWQTVNTAKVDAISPIMYHTDGGSGGSSDPIPDGTASFVVKLSDTSTTAVTVHYQTVDGSAHAGVDYDAVSGDLVFQPGETTKIVSTQLYATPGQTGEMQFLLSLSTPQNALLGTVSATAILVHDTSTSPDPAPTPTPEQPATPGGSGDAMVVIDSNWGGGYTSTVNITNDTGSATNGWKVELDTADLIVNLWNGKILSHVGDVYVIGNADYNGTVASGGSASFGFQASHTDPSATLSAQLLQLGS
ncbi:MAG: cellulase family glycosylhydrolase [Acetobacteraceae bacterium]